MHNGKSTNGSVLRKFKQLSSRSKQNVQLGSFLVPLSFQPTDRGWPALMRINPMLDWNCDNVWEYLLKMKVPYCSLYDRGYTSIGNMKNTLPNPNLEVKTNPGTFRPAYEMLDDALERAGRVFAKQ